MRGRKKTPPAAMTLDLRLRLKRSMDSGETQVHVPGDKRSKSLPELLAHSGDVSCFNKTLSLGSGIYGEARLLRDAHGNDAAVAKLTGCGSHLLGDVTQSPFRAERIEPAMIAYLWEHLAACTPCITPHLIAPYLAPGGGGYATILTGATKQALKEDEGLTSSAVFFMERATRNTMREYLCNASDTAQFDLHFRVLLFQICYTMQCIYERWPGFKHNDLKDDNVLLHNASSDGHVRYAINGHTFWVPRIGVIALISDFDFACIPGHMLDNYKTIEQEFDTPTYSISGRSNHSSDIYLFVTYIRKLHKERMGRELAAELDGLYGKFEYFNSLRCFPHAHGDVPTVAQLLFESNLFNAFLDPPPQGGATEEAYVSRWKAGSSPPPAPRWAAHETRHCPVFLSQRDARKPLLPSQLHLRSCPAANAALDAEPPQAYAPQEGAQILRALGRAAYRAPFDDNNTGFALPEEARDECMERVEQLAAAYIDEYALPYRWWCAAFTCAFVDVTQDMNMYRQDQRCWYLDLWASFWEKQGIVRYEPIQLLHFALQWRWWDVEPR